MAQGLRRRGVDVLTAQEAGRCSLPDDAQLAFASQAGRVLVTFDADFLALAVSGVRHAGLIFCSATKYTVGELIAALLLAHSVLEPDDMRDHVEFL